MNKHTESIAVKKALELHYFEKDLKTLISGLFNKLYDQIKHGDEEHQAWLKNKIEEFLINEKIK
jgi:hypothetical protein